MIMFIFWCKICFKVILFIVTCFCGVWKTLHVCVVLYVCWCDFRTIYCSMFAFYSKIYIIEWCSSEVPSSMLYGTTILLSKPWIFIPPRVWTWRHCIFFVRQTLPIMLKCAMDNGTLFFPLACLKCWHTVETCLRDVCLK